MMEQIFYPADILLPGRETDMTKWSVIACDQFTSEPEYWEKVEHLVGEAPSTLRLTLPEVYLDTDEEENRLTKIGETMRRYLKGGLLTLHPDALVYIERTDSSGKVRPGLIGAVDLEQYDYHKGSTSPVRATEGTIEERIPPRLRVRRSASIELPHIMMLINDPKKEIIEGLHRQTASMELLYDFQLMMGGGSIKGWLLTPGQKERVLLAFQELAEASDPDATEEKEDRTDAPLVFAVGDGNHSLATAKAFYEQLKAACPKQDMSTHPARFALAEVVNLHSSALEFEAIHRIVTNVNTDHLFAFLTKELGLVRESTPASEKDNASFGEDVQRITIVVKGQEERVLITRPSSKLAVGSLQNALDAYRRENRMQEEVGLDYIHGRDTLKALTWEPGSVGFILPDMKKEELFPTVKADGALPRKTFSMGHAEDKRYYTECRRFQTLIQDSLDFNHERNAQRLSSL